MIHREVHLKLIMSLLKLHLPRARVIDQDIELGELLSDLSRPLDDGREAREVHHEVLAVVEALLERSRFVFITRREVDLVFASLIKVLDQCLADARCTAGDQD